jgi:chromosome segregation protein
LQDEADGHREGHGTGAAVDHERLVNPLPDGREGGLVEERDGPQHPDPGHPAADVGRRLQDDGALDPRLLRYHRVIRLDPADELGRLDLAHRPDGRRRGVADEIVKPLAQEVDGQPAASLSVVHAPGDAELGPAGAEVLLLDDPDGDVHRRRAPDPGRDDRDAFSGQARSGIPRPGFGRRQGCRRQRRDHDDVRDVDPRQLPYSKERQGHSQRQGDRVGEDGRWQGRGPVPQAPFRDEQCVLKHLRLLAADSRKPQLPYGIQSRAREIPRKKRERDSRLRGPSLPKSGRFAYNTASARPPSRGPNDRKHTDTMSMIIKKLELQGFKSFAERTKIVFHPGITAIVGPNGTGKSNLVDAMLWVLGGHRQKNVRGDRTEEVIFSGNAKRPALNMADAVLSLADGDDALAVSHRAFRSGESEYRMNGKTVRLKDIQDELWRHAIGEKEYFVIEQGAIGNFVTSKPTEKRLFIEEAAGTAYYKDKKRQAQSKLESTEQNLIRLEDIIIEVEKAKNSLQRQAQAANRYRRLRERIRELTSHHYQRKLVLLEKTQREASVQYEASLRGEQEAAARLRQEEKEAAARRREHWDLEKALKAAQEKLFGLKSADARIASDIERETKRIEFFEEKKKRAESDRNELLEDVLHLTREIENLKGRLGGFEETLTARRAEAEAAASELAAAKDARQRSEQEIERLRGFYLQALQALTETKNESARAEKELELLLRQEDKLGAQLTEQTGYLDANAERTAALEAQIAVQSDLRQTLVGRAEDLKAALDAACASAEKVRQEIDALRARRDETAYHLQALRKIDEKERDEASADEIPGSLGVLAEIIRTDPKNALLFDAFWRDGARSRVVPAEEFLQGLPEGLRGTYLLVPTAARPSIPAEVLDRPGVIGQLKSLLQLDDRHRDRLAGLEDAVIVRDAGEAVRIWMDHPALNFLTPTGDLLLASGLLRLGQRAEGAVVLASEIRQLESEIAAFEAGTSPLAAVIDQKAKEAEALEAELGAVREEREKTERIIQDRERELRYGRGDGDRIRTTQLVFGRELEVLRSEKDRLSESLRGTGEGQARIEAEVSDLKDRIEAQERAHAGLVAGAEDLERRFFETKAGLDLVQERMNGLGDQIRATEKRKEAAAAKIEALEADARQSEEEQTRVRAEIQALQTSAEKVGAERLLAETGLEETESALERGRQALESSEAALQKTRAEEEAAKDERVRHEIRKAEVDRDLVNLDEMCWQELKKNLTELRAEIQAAAQAAPAPAEEPAEGPEPEDLGEEEAEENGTEAETPAAFEAEAAAPKPRRTVRKWRPLAEMTDEDVEKELEEAREAVNRFKAVNLMAEEEFLEQKKRFEFLSEQRGDLRESITSTEEAIRKIDEESKTQFLKALEEVNKNFRDLFTSLFKGGNAEVKLLEPDNPLESGVEIVAQPPGKRVQNLSLLSGGEKSLTSLAFLFAMFRYRPSPFCFLDEVDAALDDVNLARFLDLLREIKHQTQFILITHNYKTMEVADYIYGTTMAEPNMTKLLSVKLEKKGGEAPPDLG